MRAVQLCCPLRAAGPTGLQEVSPSRVIGISGPGFGTNQWLTRQQGSASFHGQLPAPRRRHQQALCQVRHLLGTWDTLSTLGQAWHL